MAWQITLQFWTDFADSAVMMPLGVAIPILLVALNERRAALGWTVAVGGVWAAMLLLKFLGYVVFTLDPASPLGGIDLVTPSGHVASATVIYAGLAGLLLRGPGSVFVRTLTVAVLVAVGVGFTRVLLGEHSVAEVIVGGVVGIAGASALATITRHPLPAWRPLPVLAVTAAIVLVRHGVHLSWENTIHQFAMQTVSDWKAGV